MEYRTYGPDGLAIVWERNEQAELVPRAVSTDPQGSERYVHGTAMQRSRDYRAFGMELNGQQQDRRTGWVGKETDYETSPAYPTHKLMDLSARKYDPQTGSFTSVDELWALYPAQNSYHYALHDPVNWSDPSGLEGDAIKSPSDIKPKTLVESPTTPIVTSKDDANKASFRVWNLDMLIFQFKKEEERALPGGGLPGKGSGSTSSDQGGSAGNAQSTTPDFTNRFDQIAEQTEKKYRQLASIDAGITASTLPFLLPVQFAITSVGPLTALNALNDFRPGGLLDVKANNYFSQRKRGETKVTIRGNVVQAQDIGSYLFERAMFEAGMPLLRALQIGGVLQIVQTLRGQSSIYFTNPIGWFDDPTDSRAIVQGYFDMWR